MLNVKNLFVTATVLVSQTLAAPAVLSEGNSKIQAIKGQTVPGKYIVTLKNTAQPAALDSHLRWVDKIHARDLTGAVAKGVETTFNGSYGFSGYAGSFNEGTLAEIKGHPDVESVEEDKIWTLTWLTDDQQIEDREESGKVFERSIVEQQHATWGLGSISHRSPHATEYTYHDSAGEDTYAYVIDSGIRVTHKEFEGRATPAWSAYDTYDDNVGHGTHVAGTIGGKTFGIAKKAKLLAVKVFEGNSSSTSTILSGYNWAVNDVIETGRTKKAALNMSLGGIFSFAFNTAVERAAESGVLSIVAAGNEGQNAALSSPASARSAVTVAAIDRDWACAYYSNYGSVVDIFAPGSRITSAWFKDDSAENAMSGTSMATPHVVGLALYAMSVYGITGVSDVTDHLIESATKDQVGGGTRGSPNLIGNNNNPYQ
ncbi:hypothetical protein QQS21_002570 [Conoideocrella luteorostrata]|uniref:Uncharacterized protein n=1 Tax=Conoideocrella luteorostrata TaxID=1105319 RepID=A0AAJ0CUU9_9HYPO|nr:hypothetical protein QQS21_002570 [Conoideocrella luteorostrata]